MLKSLRQQLLWTAVLFVALVTLAAALVVREVRSFSRAQTERQMLDTTRALALVVDTELHGYAMMLRALATSDSLRQDNFRAFDAQARQLLSGPDAWIVVGARDGRQLVNTRLAAGADLPAGPAPAHIWPTLDRGETHICDLARGRLENRILCVDVPVIRNGRAAYHLSVVFRPQRLQRIMDRQRLPQSRFGNVLDRQGIVVWRNVDPHRFVGRRGTPDLIEAMSRRPEGLKESVSLSGIPTFLAYSRSPQSGWTFVVAVPRSEIGLASSGALWSSILVACAILALAFLTALLAGRRLASAVGRLASAAARIAQGKAPAFQPTGIAEIDEVGTALGGAIAARNASDERFDLAQDVGGIGAWDWDLVAGLGYVSDSYKRMHGVADVDGPLTLAQIYAVMHPDDRADYTARLSAAKLSPAPSTNEYRVIHPDGSIRWIAAKGRPLFGPAGEPVRAVGVVRDITAERQAETALRQSEAELRQITDALPVLISYVDASERYRFNNRAHEEWFGVARGGNRGRLVRAVMGETNYAQVKPFIARALAGQRCSFEWQGVAPGTGAPRFYRSDYIPRRDSAGAPDGFYVLFSDVTEIKQSEARLQQLNHSLEDAVSERTAKLSAALEELRQETAERRKAEEALRQVQKLESIGQVTGGVAHDFNNLLTPIIGGLDLLQQRGLPDARAQRLVEGALQAAERARVLVQRLLAFARRQPLQPGAVDVGALATGMQELISSTLGPRIGVAVAVAPGLPPARADQNQLEMALLNLAVNARDAMPDGGTLTISATVENASGEHAAGLRPGRYVCIAVVDTGCGMDEATAARAVEPFFSTKGIGKGTGLGLSMAHGLAAQLGGGLRLTSTVGVGTNVEIWLPVAEPGDAEQAVRSGEPVAMQAAGTALLVDDEDLIRASVAQMLTTIGYAVVEADSGARALALLESGLRIDLLVTDHLMPGMTGTELARAVRERQLARAVLIISGYADVEDIAPDVPRLTKPFRHIELEAAIAALRTDAPGMC